jgi:hypothetical protein
MEGAGQIIYGAIQINVRIAEYVTAIWQGIKREAYFTGAVGSASAYEAPSKGMKDLRFSRR